MLSLSKAYFYLYCMLVLSLLFAPTMLPFIDEAVLLSMFMLGLADMIYNRAWFKYKTFWVASSVLFLYLVYSLTFCHYNIAKAITMDFWTHLKPVLAFTMAYSIAPEFTAWQRKIVKILIMIIAAVAAIAFATPYFYDIVGHHYYLGNIYLGGSIICLMIMVCDGKQGYRNNLFYVLLLILAGLMCTRSKYYGIAVVVLFMLLIYRPKIITQVSFKNSIIFMLLIVGILFVAWEKISFYFITGGAGIVEEAMATANDEETLGMMMARPALYYFSIQVFADHFWLGSGFASFASYCSSTAYNYSALYHEYGVDMIWGLSEEKDTFIADTFYPELAQFGIVGVLLLTGVVLWFCKQLKLTHRILGTVPFVAGLLVLIALGIDAVASTGPLNSLGENLFAVLGMILARVKHVGKERAAETLKAPLAEGTTVWKTVGLKLRRY